MQKDVFILGTGLSHNGSAVVLKNGQIACAIEKERLTRVKHDGGNDNIAIQYCLDALGITLDEVDLVVQCENFVVPDKNEFKGPRLFSHHNQIPVYSISHHLAHAYSVIGTSPVQSCNVLVIDGCGSPSVHCTETLLPSLQELEVIEGPSNQFVYEKDSFYHYDGSSLRVIFKDFSIMDAPRPGINSLPTTRHSIGGFYAYISHYCFGNMNDAGKLMGLAPYGTPGKISLQAFDLQGGRVFVSDDWKHQFNNPAIDYDDFKTKFQYYADIAYWAQQQVEEAILYIARSRQALHPSKSLGYSGGVALNIKSNSRILEEGIAEALYIEPAAADNGLALGCAYYGWLEILKRKKQVHNGNTCFGKRYSTDDIQEVLLQHQGQLNFEKLSSTVLNEIVGQKLKAGQTVGWFQGASEFGPRALGKRSILANPCLSEMQQHINANIKFREDFRPFAPAVLKEDYFTYFHGKGSNPYMLFADRLKENWNGRFDAITHVDGSSRVQTVDDDWNSEFYALLQEVKKQTGHGLLLNTSFNKKGVPIVEKPEEAIALFIESALDVLVLNDWLATKKERNPGIRSTNR